MNEYEYGAGELLGDRASRIRSSEDTRRFLALLKQDMGEAYLGDSTDGQTPILNAHRYDIGNVVIRIQTKKSAFVTFTEVRAVAWTILDSPRWHT